MDRNTHSNRSLIFQFGSSEPNIVDLDQVYEDESDGTLQGDEFEDRFVNPTPDVEVIGTSNLSRAPFETHIQRLDVFSFDGTTYKPGKTVELLDGDFLRITAIVPDHNTELVALKGIRFRRNKLLDGFLEMKLNEVTMLLEYDETDPRDVNHQSVMTVQLLEVVKVRKMVKTNHQFPAFSFREVDDNYRKQGKEYVSMNGPLVCRTKQVLISKSEGYLQVLGCDEADDGYGLNDDDLRKNFRGETVKGGACKVWLPGEKSFDRNERAKCANIDLLHFNRRTPRLQNQDTSRADDYAVDGLITEQRYNFADGFCGAGGASRGAKAAGLRVDWGFDYDRAAIDSYSRNFYGTRCEAIPVHEFVTILTEDFKVDILHISPPCQPFSPIHTRRGKNDELNQATFLAVADLIAKVKARVVTLEETFGLTLQVDALPWFKSIIQMFTKLGFSVRWKVFNLCDFGLPQPRKRLIIFASCPGEVLPEFPKPTHCKAADLYRFPALSRFATVNDAIAEIPIDFTHHDVRNAPARDDPQYSAYLPLRHTILCSSGPQSHPSGKRVFTLRELACLQSFPLEHQFGPMGARMQIGNAYPPIVAKVFFEAVIKALQKADGTNDSKSIPPQHPASASIIPPPPPPPTTPSPSSPTGKLNHIAHVLHNNFAPRCIQFIDRPPADANARNVAYRFLVEGLLAQVVEKLDEVETGRDEDLRARRRQLIQETQEWLRELDRVGDGEGF